jgi:hypothetical protein
MSEPLPDMVRAERGSKTALVTFGSHINEGRESAFAMQHVIERLGRRHVFDSLMIRPRDNHWYLNGACGLGSGVEEVAGALSDFNRCYDRVVYTGNSMGAYAALLYGVLAGARQIIAFSPQTNLASEFRARHGDGRWRGEIALINQTYPVDHYCIAAAMRRGAGVSRIAVHVGADDLRDRAQAADIEDHPAVELVLHEREGHDLVKSLRRTGELERLIAASLGLGI